MQVEALFIIIMICIVFAFLCYAMKKALSIIIGILLTLIAVSGIVWFIKGQQMPFAINPTTRHEIKTVVYPDGTKKQMFTDNKGIHHNVVDHWKNVIDEKEFEVEIIEPVTEYFGLNYSTLDTRCKTKYELVKKK